MSLACQTSDISIANYQDSTDYTYKWAVIPTDKSFDAFLSAKVTSKLDIPINYVKEGYIEVTCSAFSVNFGTSTTKKMYIVITNQEIINVGFNIPSIATFYESDEIYIQG